MGKINLQVFKREATKAFNTKLVRDIAVDEANKVLERAKKIAIKEFNTHPVTRELRAGPEAQNVSNTLGGRGNLFSFIGFMSGHRYMQLNGSSHGDSAGYSGVLRMASDGEGDAAGAMGGFAEITIPVSNDYNDCHAVSFLSTRNQNGDHYGYWATGVSTSNSSSRVNYIRIKDHAGGNIQGGTITLYAFVT